MDYELQFLVMIKTGDRASIFSLLYSQLPGTEVSSPGSLDFGLNFIRVERNDLADDQTSESVQDEYLNYPVRVEVVPKFDTVTVRNQVATARQLFAFFDQRGFEAVICADFEELL